MRCSSTSSIMGKGVVSPNFAHLCRIGQFQRERNKILIVFIGESRIFQGAPTPKGRVANLLFDQILLKNT